MKMGAPKINFPKLKLPAFRLPKLPASMEGMKFIPEPSFFKKKLLILEIGDDWLKMLGVYEDRKSRRAEWTETESLEGLEEPGISLKILQAMRVHAFKPDQVLISYPAQHLTIRMLSLPSIDPQEIRDIVDLQAVKQTPYSREEITTGFQVMETDAAGYSRVFLAISHRDQVIRYFRIGEMARVLADQVVPSVEGLRSWYAGFLAAEAHAPESAGTLLLEFGATHTHLLIMNGDKLVFSRTLPLGARQMKEQGAAAEGEFVREVTRSMESGTAEAKLEKVHRMVLTGVADGIKNVAAVLTRELNLPCEVVDSFEGVQQQLTRPLQESSAHVSWASMLGLMIAPAQSMINLVPPEIKLRKQLEERGRDLAWCGTLLLSLVMIISMIGFEKIYRRTAYLDALKKEYVSVRPESEEMEKTLGKIKLAQDQMGAGGSFLDVLKDVTGVLPDSMTLTAIQYQDRDKSLVLRGITQEMSSVFQLLSTLESTPYLESVKTRNVSKRKVGEKELSEFEIVAGITRGGPAGAS